MAALRAGLAMPICGVGAMVVRPVVMGAMIVPGMGMVVPRHRCGTAHGRRDEKIGGRRSQGGGRRAAKSCPHDVEGREPHRIDV